MTAPHTSVVIEPRAALVLIDIQTGFEDPAWGRPGGNAAEAARCMGRLAEAWVATGRPIVVVRHDSASPNSPLRPDASGNALVDWVTALDPALLVSKNVNSAFLGEPNLDHWLRERDIGQIVPVGISTNHCVETTTRMGGNLGYDVILPIDATSTFDRTGPDGIVVTAEELTRATAANLHGEFSTVTTTAEVLRALGPVPTMAG